MLPRRKQESQRALPTASRVKDTEDYLTARGANPRTGLITPFTPFPPSLPGSGFLPGSYCVSPSSYTLDAQVNFRERTEQQDDPPDIAGEYSLLTNKAVSPTSLPPQATSAGRLGHQKRHARPQILIQSTHPVLSRYGPERFQYVKETLCYPRLQDLKRQGIEGLAAIQESSIQPFGEKTNENSSDRPEYRPILADQSCRIERKPIGSPPRNGCSSNKEPSLAVKQPCPSHIQPKQTRCLSDQLPKILLRRPSQAGRPRVHSQDIATPSVTAMNAPAAVCQGVRELHQSEQPVNKILVHFKAMFGFLLKQAAETIFAQKVAEHLRIFSDESLSAKERLAGTRCLLLIAWKLVVAVIVTLTIWSVVAAIKSALDAVLAPVWAVVRMVAWLIR